MSIYYVCIGNSDDKLTQAQWHDFIDDLDITIKLADHTHGRWFSEPKSQWQSACWCIEASEHWVEEGLKPVLGLLAGRYRQDSIALAKSETELVTPAAGMVSV